MEQSTRIDVEAPVEQVWEVLREVERWPEWTPTVTSVRRLDDGPLAVGSRVRVEQPRIPPTDYVATELEPSCSFTWVATGPGVRTTARHLLEELDTGGTRVTLAVEQAGPGGVVMGRFYRRLTDRYLTAEIEGIRARSEGRVCSTAVPEPSRPTAPSGQEDLHAGLVPRPDVGVEQSRSVTRAWMASEPQIRAKPRWPS